jgi:hypothetical protein
MGSRVFQESEGREEREGKLVIKDLWERKDREEIREKWEREDLRVSQDRRDH